MTDVRAVLEAEVRRRTRTDRRYKTFAKVMAWLTLLSAVVVILRDHSFWKLFQTVAPLVALVGISARYTPRHQKALRDAIADPDPALDPHFVQTLASLDPKVYALGREAVAARFADRLPEIGPEEWRTLARSLSKARESDAPRFLSMLRAAGTVSAIEPTEAFANATKTERLRTAARDALGEMRLRAARERVLGAVESADLQRSQELGRLRL